MIKTKNVLILSFLMIGWLSVRCQAPNSIKQIEYTTLTRGYQKHVIISPDSVITTVEGREENKSSKRALSKNEWSALIGSLKNTKLSEIPTLKSPTEKRAYDGARHSTLILTIKDQPTLTHSFDDEDANEKLLPLMKAVKKIEGSDD